MNSAIMVLLSSTLIKFYFESIPTVSWIVSLAGRKAAYKAGQKLNMCILRRIIVLSYDNNYEVPWFLYIYTMCTADCHRFL